MIRVIFGPIAGVISPEGEKPARYDSRSDILRREVAIVERLSKTGFGLTRISLEMELGELVRMRENFSGESVHAGRLPKDLFGLHH